MRRLALLTAIALVALLAAGSAAARPSPDVWERTYGTDDSDETFWDGIETPNGYLLVGSATEPARYDSYDGYAVKLSDSGAVEWSRRFNVSDDDSLKAAARTADGGYVLAGDAVTFTEAGGGPRWSPNVSGFVAKVDANGSVLWTRETGSDAVYSVVPVGDGVVVEGSSLIRYRSDGSIAWNRTNDTDIDDVARTPDGLVVAGNANGRVVRELAEDGSVERTVYRDDERGTFGRIAVLDRGYFVGGQRYSETASQYVDVTARLGSDGEVRWRHTEYETNEGSSVVDVGEGAGELYSVLETNDGETLVRFTDDGEVLGSHALSFTEGIVAARSDHYLYASERGEDAAVGVADLVAPAAAVDAPSRVGVGQYVRFDAGGTSDNLGIASYRWDLDGDGQPDRRTDQPTVSSRFETLGPRTVTMIASDAFGNTDRASVRVTVSDDSPPTARLSVGPDPAVVAEETTFDASDSGDNHVIGAYRWDLGADGTVEAETEDGYFTHVFGTTGERTVRVTVVDESNNTASAMATVAVVQNERPELSTSAERLSGARYRLRANVTDEHGHAMVRWDLPGGSTYGRSVVVDLPPGEVEIPVAAVDRFGARDYDTVTVTVPGTPQSGSETEGSAADAATASTTGAADASRTDDHPSSTSARPTHGSGAGFGAFAGLAGLAALGAARLGRL